RRIQDILTIQLAAMEASIDGMAIVDQEGKFIYLNNSFAHLFGYDNPEELMGSVWLKLYNMEEQQRFESHIIPYFKRKKNWRGRTMGRRKDGVSIHHEVSLTSITDNQFICVVRDITSQKLAEEALIESEEKFRAISTSAQDAIVMIDDNGKIIYWNKSAEKMFGYNSLDVMGKDAHLLLTPNNFHDTYRKGFSAFRKSGKGFVVGKTKEFEAIKKDGTLFPIELSVSAVRLRQKWSAIAILRDISVRKKMEEELRKTSKLESLGILAGGIAHDFNNILTGIMGNVYIAKKLSESGSKIYNLLSDAELAMVRAKDLTYQLLTFAKGGVPLKITVSVSELIKNSVNFAVRGSNLIPEYRFDDSLWPVDIDSSQINQVINNLIINAQQASPAGGKVYVSGFNVNLTDQMGLPLKSGKYIKIVFRDEGLGIPEDAISKIFDPFYTTKQDGSGLGLTIVYSIIRKHNGYIDVSSKLGHGTEFVIFLPASEQKPQEVQSEIEPEEEYHGCGRVLVMEDESAVRDVIFEYLNLLGYEVDFAISGNEAIEKYSHSMNTSVAFDAVIMDLTIKGGMGGKDTMRKLLAIDPNVKAIVSSGYSQDSILANYSAFGFSGMICKPFNIEDLGKVLKRILRS
ncbi:PAS domain S-box protein, partial [bacterium]|nr:PAS domain S-box protein [candidate division CSSED10-310 bacterium]